MEMIYTFASRSLSMKGQERQDWGRSRGVRVIFFFFLRWERLGNIPLDGDDEKIVAWSHVLALLLSLELWMNTQTNPVS